MKIFGLLKLEVLTTWRNGAPTRRVKDLRQIKYKTIETKAKGQKY